MGHNTILTALYIHNVFDRMYTVTPVLVLCAILSATATTSC